MKKYLIALAAMALAVSSCTEKMSSWDNVPDGATPEKTKLVKRLTETRWSAYEHEVEFAGTSDFTYDADNRIVKIISKYSYGYIDEIRTKTQSRVYSGNTVTYTDVWSDGKSSRTTVLFDGNKVIKVNDDDGHSSYYLYDNNSERVTSVTMDIDGYSVYEFVWNELGNMVSLVYTYEKAVIPFSYTSKINKCNIAIEQLYFDTFMFLSEFMDRNVLGTLSSNYLVEKIDEGGDFVYNFLYVFDEEGYPIEVYIPGKIRENGGSWGPTKYELEYY